MQGPMTFQAGGAAPSIADLLQFGVVQSSNLEAVRQTLYDFQVYPTAGVAGALQFFQAPLGQGATSATGAVALTAKTYADTNMVVAGQLPRFVNFLMQSIEVFFEPGSVATASTYTKQAITTVIAVPTAALTAGPNDVDTIRQTGWLELFISNKNYLREAPLGRFPPKTQLDLDAAIATNSATTLGITALSAKFYGRPYYVEPWIMLPENANFSVSCNWPVLTPTPSGFNGRLGIVLDGITYRATQ